MSDTPQTPLERITHAYLVADMVGQQPRIADYVRANPQYGRELLTWAQTQGVDVTCHRCGAAVDLDAGVLALRTLGRLYCREHLIAGTERLKTAIRQQAQEEGQGN